MTQRPGPPSILNLIFCRRKKDCGNSCECKKHRLICNLACKNCAGCICSNVENYFI